MLKLSIDSADPQWLDLGARFVQQSSSGLGLDNQAAVQLGQAVAAACRNVLEHAYEASDEVRYQLEVRVEAGALVVGVCDQGLPFDERHLHSKFRQLVDRIRLVNLGRQGKRLELVKELHANQVDAHLTAADHSPAPVDLQSPLQIRVANADDAVPVARCVYRCYGYSYGSDYLYSPQRLQQLWQSGAVTSVVATVGDELVGHLCYWLDQPGDLVGESTDAVVDPRYRGQHIFEKLRHQLIEVVRAQGKLGMVSEAVAVHPYSQKGVISTGAVETGLMLGDLPATLDFKGIEESLPARQSCMLCYLRLNPEPQRRVFLPTRHRAILEKVYARTGLNRVLLEQPRDPELDEHSLLEVHLDSGWEEAALRVLRFGRDLEDLVRAHLQHLLANNVPYVYLELPLGDPALGQSLEGLEALGFSFAGVVPELAQGDILRLHFLTDIELDDKICAVSDWGNEIKDYVLARAKVGSLSR